jgi:hypothetical protein
MYSILNATYVFLSYITGLCEPSNNYIENKCITFTVGSGTGCEWMCNYCAENLGTNNYYFTDNVCKYEEKTGFFRRYVFDSEYKRIVASNGCVGNPIAGHSYTCCA